MGHRAKASEWGSSISGWLAIILYHFVLVITCVIETLISFERRINEFAIGTSTRKSYMIIVVNYHVKIRPFFTNRQPADLQKTRIF